MSCLGGGMDVAGSSAEEEGTGVEGDLVMEDRSKDSLAARSALSDELATEYFVCKDYLGSASDFLTQTAFCFGLVGSSNAEGGGEVSGALIGSLT